MTDETASMTAFSSWNLISFLFGCMFTSIDDGSVWMRRNTTGYRPSKSLSLYPYYYHDFLVPEEGKPVLIGEVSMCNDDANDNRFYEPTGRFSDIEEDVPAEFLLTNEL